MTAFDDAADRIVGALKRLDSRSRAMISAAFPSWRYQGVSMDVYWIDQTATEHEERDASLDTALDRVRALCGGEQSLVILERDDGAQFSVGGDARTGLIVDYTEDQQEHYQLENPEMAGRSDEIWVVTAGQGSEFPAAVLCDLELAFAAVRWWYGGKEDLKWRRV